MAAQLPLNPVEPGMVAPAAPVLAPPAPGDKSGVLLLAPGAPAAPLTVSQVHWTFASYYNDATKDLLRPRAAAVLRNFDSGADAQRAEDLLQMILCNPSTLHTFL
jgi:hypothetical protein